MVTVPFTVNEFQRKIYSCDDYSTENYLCHQNPSSVFAVNAFENLPELFINAVETVR